MINGLRGRLVLLVLVASLATSHVAAAWVAEAHAQIAEAAVRALPDAMPPFFRVGFVEVGRSAVDPDFYRLRDLQQLRNAESPEHYLDVELLEGAEWPATRSQFLALVAGLDEDVFAVGTLPYSLAEGVQKLAASFAQVRLDPGDEWARARALHHAELMAHYSADLCQPLHTTIHYNGRAGKDGSSPRTGIHGNTDALARVVFELGPPETGAVVASHDLLEAIQREFAASHELVDRVYELEAGLDPVSPEAMTFARERVAASIRFTASLFLTAWELSGKIDLPRWYRELQTASVGGTPASPAADSPR